MSTPEPHYDTLCKTSVNKSDEFIRRILPKETYARLRTMFAIVNPEEQRRLARLGGLAAQRSGKAHRFKAGSQEAVDAGQKGGLARRKKLEALPTECDPDYRRHLRYMHCYRESLYVCAVSRPFCAYGINASVTL